MELTVNTSLMDLYSCPEFTQAQGRLIVSSSDEFSGDKTLRELQATHPAWNADDIIYGLNNLKRVYEEYGQYVFCPDTERPGVCLFRLPSEHRIHEEYFILLAGGAYGAVCTMIESLPVAARLNELGVDVFCVNYTVADAGSFIQGLMPKPLEDIASCWRYIKENEEKFGIRADTYFLGGFSAGGHLAGCFALDRIGAKRYGVPAPSGLLLAYPLISVESIGNKRMRDFMKAGLFGAASLRNDPSEYEIHKKVTTAYPRTFYVYALDDDTIPQNNPSLMKRALEDCSVPFMFDAYEKGGHGFGLGGTAPGSAYVRKAADFLLEKIK